MFDNFSETFTFLTKWNITFQQLLFLQMVLGYQEGKESKMYATATEYFSLSTEVRGSIKEMSAQLVEKGIILKSIEITKPEDLNKIEISSKFLKDFYKSSNEYGEELYLIYPQSTIINGVEQNLRTIGGRYNDMDDCLQSYARAIRWSPTTHAKVIEAVLWGIENNYNFPGIGLFIANREWTAIDNKRNNGILNSSAMKLV